MMKCVFKQIQTRSKVLLVNIIMLFVYVYVAVRFARQRWHI